MPLVPVVVVENLKDAAYNNDGDLTPDHFQKNVKIHPQ